MCNFYRSGYERIFLCVNSHKFIVNSYCVHLNLRAPPIVLSTYICLFCDVFLWSSFMNKATMHTVSQYCDLQQEVIASVDGTQDDMSICLHIFSVHVYISATVSSLSSQALSSSLLVICKHIRDDCGMQPLHDAESQNRCFCLNVLGSHCPVSLSTSSPLPFIRSINQYSAKIDRYERYMWCLSFCA